MSDIKVIKSDGVHYKNYLAKCGGQSGMRTIEVIGTRAINMEALKHC